MEMWHQPRLAADQLHQRAIDFDAVQRRQAQTPQPRLTGKQVLAKLSQAALVVSDVHAGEDDFLRAAVDLARYRIADCFKRERHAWSARLPDRTEGATVVAARLHRDEAADVPHEPSRHWRHDVIGCQAV